MGARGRAILHVDMDAFFASVEQRDDPGCRGKPVLVGGPSGRGVVCAASYEARAFGCRSAMPMARARALCPQAIVKKPRFEAYSAASEGARIVFEKFTPLVEPLSLDEAFLDVGASVRLLGEPEHIAREIRAMVRRELSLPCSVGVARNKFLAKLASDLAKPDGLRVMPWEQEPLQRELDVLPVSSIWGVGPATQARLHALGVRTLRDLRLASDALLKGALGGDVERARALAQGIDHRPVVSEREAKSVGHEETFGENLGDPRAMRGVLLAQVEHVARRLRGRGWRAHGLVLKLRHPDFRTISRARTLPRPTDETAELWKAAGELLEGWCASADFGPLRLLGVSLQVEPARAQMELFDESDPRASALDRATDQIVRRFGSSAIARGGSLGRDRRRPPAEG